MPKPKKLPPLSCPQCGADVPQNAHACPDCGACHETGWSEQARYDALDLPNQDFDYQDFVEREFNPTRNRRSHRRWWWLVAALLLLAWIFGFVL